jgi:two-component system response regulator DctR
MTIPLTRVHIIDDDPDIRDALKWLFESRNISAEAWPDAEAFLDSPWCEFEGCLLIDIRMRGLSGIELFERLKVQGCLLPVIFLTGHAEVSMAVDALKNGAHDFVEKPFNDNDLVDRVITALNVEARDRERAHVRADIVERMKGLSSRERAVMDLLLAGKKNKVIAEDLGISMRTVEVHRSHIFEKMDVRSAVELANLIANLPSPKISH